MNTPSPPIDIAPSLRVSSASPRSSNLTSALQQAGHNTSNTPMDIPNHTSTDNRPGPTRQDSLGYGLSGSHSGARPISVQGKQRRESNNTGSYMGGMSWGGISVGSWLQDDVTMAGTSPYNVQSPSLHSSSYLPKMEANFWNNLRCCDTGFSDLHELLQHFEDVHKDAPSTFPYRTSVPNSGGIYRARGATPVNQMNFNNNQNAGNKISGTNTSSRAQQQTQDGFHKPSLSNMQDMDTLGEMEIDDDQPLPGAHSMPSFSQRPDGFPQNSTAPVNPSNVMPDGSTYGPSDSTLRGSTDFSQRNNPMVSSVNTPSIGLQTTSPQQQQQQLSPQTNALPSADDIASNPQLMASLQAEFGNLDFTGNGGEMLDLCINDPAKSLFTDQGAINSQQFPQFSFLNGANANTEEVARRLQHAQQLAAARGQLPSEEDRPFKCPVIGCEKAYKNANGLRYHEKHGHSTQKLKENGDGSYSIVDPVTSIPYPGTVGMEKEKPYRCEVCGKRYKNLNGLKYHRNHSPPCNPDFKFGEVGLPGMGNTNNASNGNGGITSGNMGGGSLGDGMF